MRQVRGHELRDPNEGPERNERSKRAAGKGEQKTLRQQLPHQAPSARAHREPKRDFSCRTEARASRRLATFAQAIRKTSAKAARTTEATGIRRPLFGAREERRSMDCKRSDASRSRVALVNASCNHAKIGTHLLDRHARPCPPKQSQPTHIVVRKPVDPRLQSLLHCERHPERARNRLRASESWTRYPNDGIGGLIENDILPTSEGSAPNCPRHRSLLTTTTAFAPRLAQSESTKPRPCEECGSKRRSSCRRPRSPGLRVRCRQLEMPPHTVRRPLVP